MHQQLTPLLLELEQALIAAELWEHTMPSMEALASPEPFCVDTLNANQWLQWVFLPRMRALIEAQSPLPRNFAISPYVEEALKDHAHLSHLTAPLIAIETLLKA